MRKKQFLALFLCNLTPFIVGAGALPLLPIYAADLGAPPVITGYYLAFAYLALTAGTLSAGWLSERFGRRRAWLALAGVVGVPVTWAVGRATNLWALSALTAGLWFLGGVGLTLTSILAGLSAGPGERGKVFGFLSLAGARRRSSSLSWARVFHPAAKGTHHCLQPPGCMRTPGAIILNRPSTTTAALIDGRVSMMRSFATVLSSLV